MALALDKRFESLSEVFQNTKDSLIEKAEKAASSVSDVTNKGVDTAVQAKDKLTITTGKAVNTLTETAKQTGDSLKDSVDVTLRKAENFSNSVSTEVDKSLSALIERRLDTIKVWIDAHPVISWATKALLWGVNHPILSGIILLLVIFLLWQLFKAFGSIVEKGFLYILQAPFKLIYSLITSFKPLGNFRVGRLTIKQHEANVLNFNPEISTSISHEDKERLKSILTRLEAIRQEQNNLLQELRGILASDKDN